MVPQSKKSRLIGLCETRFIERHNAVNTFVELFPAIVATLQEVSNSKKAVSGTASTLLASIEKPSFVVSLLVCEYLFSLTLPLSTYLQNPQHDLVSSLKYADDIVKKLRNLRSSDSDSDEKQFKIIFEKAQRLAEEVLDIEIKVPRLTVKQTARDNHPNTSAEEFFRRSVFIPCLDILISGLIQRFGKNREFLSSIEVLLPTNASSCFDVDKLLKLKFLFEDRTSESALTAEYLLWCEKWKAVNENPTGMLTVLDKCDKKFYPNIYYLLCVLATLPLSTAEVERSFSSMKRIKSFLRNKMGNERLTGLALMSIHYPVPVTVEEVLNIMASNRGKRRLLLQRYIPFFSN